jgi:hypothetical protein
MNISLEDAQQLCAANELDPVNLVDPDMVVNNVLAILKYMQDDKLVKLRRQNKPAYERVMEEAFPEFSNNFYFIFQKVISGEDITPLYGMLLQIKLIKENKKSFENAEKSVVGALAEKYVKKK